MSFSKLSYNIWESLPMLLELYEVILPCPPFYTLAMGTADIQSVCNILSQEEETENKFKTDLENKLKAHGVSLFKIKHINFHKLNVSVYIMYD